MFKLLSLCVRGKSETDFVFTRPDGSPVVDVRDDWYGMSVRAGLGKWVAAKTAKGKDYQMYVGLNVHDLRRSAVRNMIRAGVPEKLAMLISGHRTRAMLDRYDIVDTSDLAVASEKIERYHHKPVTDAAATVQAEAVLN